MFPLFIGNLFQQLYNMVDTLIVSRFVGADAMAAVGATGTIMFLMLGFANGLATGFTVLTSQCYGARDEGRLRHSVANAIILAVIVTALTTFLSVVSMKSVLRIMNTPDNIFDYSYSYIITIAYGICASVFYNLGASILRAIGNSKVPLYFLILSAVLNVILDLVCIVGLDLKTFGAALATVVSQGISAVLCFIYIYKKQHSIWPDKRDWHLEARDTSHQLRVGIPMALQFAITASGTMIMQAAINLYGSTAVASFSAASKLQSLITQGMPSIGQTIAAYAGQNFGAGRYDRLKDGVKSSLIIMTIYSVVAAILALTLLEPAMYLFFGTADKVAVQLPWALPYIRFCAICYIPLSAIFIFRNMMQGCGFGFLPMMGGVVELISRAIMAALSMKLMIYELASACDPAAWLTTGIFVFAAWLYVAPKIEKMFAGRQVNE
jgi:putative MATE family efflux protein